MRRIIDACMTILLLFWAFTGTQLSLLCMRSGSKEDEKKTSFPVIMIMAAVIIGLVLNANGIK